MKKQKLSLNDLRVQSFETESPAGRAKTQAMAGGLSDPLTGFRCTFECADTGNSVCTGVCACVYCPTDDFSGCIPCEGEEIA